MMERDMRQLETFADFAGESRPTGGQVNFKCCPACGSDEWKAYVNPETGDWFCFAGRHSAGGVVDVGMATATMGADLLRMLDTTRDELVWSETEMPPYHTLSRAAQQYLYRRGFSDEEIQAAGIVEWEDKYRILFPYFQSGDLIFWTSRRYSTVLGDGPPYWSQPGKKPLYRTPFLREIFPKKLVLVEGVFDAWAVQRAGYQALALGGKTLPKYHVKNLLTFAENYDIIYVLLDCDALGKAIDIQDALQVRLRQPVSLRVPPHTGDPRRLRAGQDTGDHWMNNKKAQEFADELDAIKGSIAPGNLILDTFGRLAQHQVKLCDAMIAMYDRQVSSLKELRQLMDELKGSE